MSPNVCVAYGLLTNSIDQTKPYLVLCALRFSGWGPYIVVESQCLCGIWPFDKQHRRDEAQFSIVCPAPQWMGPILGDDSIMGG